MNDLDLSDLDNFVKDEEGPSDPRNYEKSLKIIKDSMGTVKQEILLTLPDGSSHIVYVMDINISNKGQVTVDFGTPSEERKAELAVHVEKCVTMQINDALRNIKMNKRWWKW
ncbi:head vertex assembly chaperone [Pectobacterium bacteriophage PM2]|uniref:Head vertex assembly chaperone n=1 Tax=Pectobacterium bacteriophage PM2 TaxID=1429794 RepID=A0A0A0Q0A6_9CAUD|nr:head vertex assembly chaperone [Pectobacterium bacteriophage PM2]AHY25001.1 head vertex assembly chaperone [Pectobacterium bacteriophage PM2]